MPYMRQSQEPVVGYCSDETRIGEGGALKAAAAGRFVGVNLTSRARRLLTRTSTTGGAVARTES